MPENAVVRARISDQVKKDAATALAAVGLTVSDAFRLLLTRIAQDKGFPFELLTSNKKTMAVRATRNDESVTIEKIDSRLMSPSPEKTTTAVTRHDEEWVTVRDMDPLMEID
jgi:DNA-damage-inducible protein J